MSFKDRLLLWWGSLHIGEVIRRRVVRRELRRHLTPSTSPSARGGGDRRVLDAGCGRGDIALWIAERYPDVRVDAVDIDPRLVELVQRRITASGLRNVRAIVSDIAAMSRTTPSSISPSKQEGEKLDYGIICSVDVFEHLKNPTRALATLAAALVPGGTLLIHVPRATQRRFFRRFEHYEQHDHERDGFEPEELTALMEAAGLTVHAVRHTFGPPGALAWELFHLASRAGKWLALLTYPIPWALAWIDGWFRWKRGNGVLMIARNVKVQSSNVK